MTWARLDDKRALNRKLREAGFEARGLDEAAICQVAADESDGFISTDTVEMLGVAHHCRKWRQLAKRLVEVGRWTEAEGGWTINGYLDFNPSHADIEAEKERKRMAGAIGGRRSGESRRRSRTEAGASARSEAAAGVVLPPPANPVPYPYPYPPLVPLNGHEAGGSAKGETEEQKRQTPHPLAARWLEVTGATSAEAVAEAEAVIAHLRRHLDGAVIDERIGYCATLDSRPRSAQYLLTVCRRFGAENHIQIPDLPEVAR